MHQPDEMSRSNPLAGLLWIVVGMLAVPAIAVYGVIQSSQTSSDEPPVATQAPLLPWMAKVPPGPPGDVIRRGYTIVSSTYETLPDRVGNGLHCTSCHLDGGTVANAGPWIGLPGVFPEYRARSGKVDSLPRRINDCFERSLDGKPLDESGSEMAEILAYITFLSADAPGGKPPPGRGFPKIQPPRTPDRAAGATKYATACAACHQPDGGGLLAGSKYQFPPLWGPRAFNIGAGMARLDTASAFIRANMPRGAGGTVSEQDAYDIADYMIHQPRPDFAGKANDWPKGGKPRDARY